MAKPKSNDNRNNNKKSTEQRIQEEASLRLKYFIEDLRHDSMFRHRLFYPLLYKEIVRGNQYTQFDKNDAVKGVNQSVSEVIYEYYLLKMEKFDNDSAAQVFQAILYSNGPMLPENERLYLSDSSNSNSLLNPANKKRIINNAAVFLDILNDDNLFNFVFSSSVGKDLDAMRSRFSQLVKSANKPTGSDIHSSKISNNVTKNIKLLSKHFDKIRHDDIVKTVNFLIYMGNPRNIVTDFSYRPMSQNMLESYLDYDTDTDPDTEIRIQLEQALDTKIFERDLNSQLDIYLPMVIKAYTVICKDGNDALLTMDQSTFSKSANVPYEIKNNLKLKIQRTLTRAVDYTRNYITRELLDTAKDYKKDSKFISRILTYIIRDLTAGKNVSNAIRNKLTFDNFIANTDNDLNELLLNLFSSDIEYIFELCNNSMTNRSTKQKNFADAWDTAKGDEIIKILRTPLENMEKISSDLYSYIVQFLRGYYLPHRSTIKSKIARELYDHVSGIDVSEAESMAVDILNEMTKKAVEYVKDADKNNLTKIINISDISSSVIERLSASLINKFAKILKKPSLKPLENIPSAMKDDIEDAYRVIIMGEITSSIKDDLANIHQYLDHLLSIKDLSGERIFNIIRNSNDFKNMFKSIYYKREALIKTASKLKNTSIIGDTLYNIYTNEVRDLDSHSLNVFSSPDSYEKVFSPITDVKYHNYDELYKDLANGSAYTPPEYNNVPVKDTKALAYYLLESYFRYFLRPILVNLLSYALDNFEYTSRANDIEADVVSKDKLHLSKMLAPANAGMFTIDGAVAQDIAKFTYIMMSDRYSGISYNNPDDVMKFLNEVYGLKYFNVVIYGSRDAYLYLNNIGVPQLYRGAKTKVPITDLKRNYDFLMDPSNGLYKNISLSQKKKK